jgi:3-oxoadipate enol-lactonase
MPKIKVKNISLYYETHGQGQPVVFVPGFNADHFVWSNIVDAYAKNYQVIVFDNRGVGQSSCPDVPYTVDMMAEDVVELCKALKLERCHFVGNSMGSAIVQTIAYKYPDMVRSAILCNAFTKIDIKFGLFAKAQLEFIKAGATPRALAEGVLGWVFSGNYLKQEGRVDKLIEQTLANPYPITEVGYRNQLHALLTFDSSSWVTQIKRLCMIVTTKQDLIASERQARELEQLLPAALCECIYDAGHLPHIEQPEEFNKIVLTHIAQRSK